MPSTNRPGTVIFKYVMPEWQRPMLAELAQKNGMSISEIIDYIIQASYPSTSASAIRKFYAKEKDA